MATARAMVQTAPKTLELREFEIPETGADDALLRVEACGICGTDYELYDGALPMLKLPLIPGHEPVGIIERIGSIAARNWGVREGDRVAVEPKVACGACRYCLSGRHRLCSAPGSTSYGITPLAMAPGLWGGYATHMRLAPHSVVHKLSIRIAPRIAVLFNPLAAGIRWAVQMPGTTIGDKVLILGPGQRGLTSVIAAREAGAALIAVTGLARDRAKLALAREFGATHTIDVSQQDPVAAVRDITGGEMMDVVVDVAAADPYTVVEAIAAVRPGGTVVLAAAKGVNPVKELLSDQIVNREIRILGARGVDYSSYALAVGMIESGRYPLEKMHTHAIPLPRAAYALDLLAGRVAGESAIHIAIIP
jgi:2-desacetyl-2-hydroxyethyl bacteriochlorophyllide A dehydrogenase